jgi:hypothetical protein
MMKSDGKRRVKPMEGRVKQLKIAAKRCENAPKAMQLLREEGKTHDWALDLEPLALPPDLPPVILMVWMGWLF